MCRITFNPNIVQQARIATNGLLGDFVIRYDVQRDTGIGDIQVGPSEEVSGFPAPPEGPIPVSPSSVSGVKRTLCPLLRSQRPAGRPQERGVCHRHQRLHAGQEDPTGKSRPSEARRATFSLPKIPPSGRAGKKRIIFSRRLLCGRKVSVHGVMERLPRPLILSHHPHSEQTGVCVGTQQTFVM